MATFGRPTFVKKFGYLGEAIEAKIELFAVRTVKYQHILTRCDMAGQKRMLCRGASLVTIALLAITLETGKGIEKLCNLTRNVLLVNASKD